MHLLLLGVLCIALAWGCCCACLVVLPVFGACRATSSCALPDSVEMWEAVKASACSVVCTETCAMTVDCQRYLCSYAGLPSSWCRCDCQLVPLVSRSVQLCRPGLPLCVQRLLASVRVSLRVLRFLASLSDSRLAACAVARLPSRRSAYGSQCLKLCAVCAWHAAACCRVLLSRCFLLRPLGSVASCPA